MSKSLMDLADELFEEDIEEIEDISLEDLGVGEDIVDHVEQPDKNLRYKGDVLEYPCFLIRGFKYEHQGSLDMGIEGGDTPVFIDFEGEVFLNWHTENSFRGISKMLRYEGFEVIYIDKDRREKEITLDSIEEVIWL